MLTSCGTVYCNWSCLWVCLFVGVFVGVVVCLCGSVNTITRNCVHRSYQTGFVGEGSDHLQLIKFWPFYGRAKIFGSALLQPACSICVSLSTFFETETENVTDQINSKKIELNCVWCIVYHWRPPHVAVCNCTQENGCGVLSASAQATVAVLAACSNHCLLQQHLQDALRIPCHQVFIALACTAGRVQYCCNIVAFLLVAIIFCIWNNLNVSNLIYHVLKTSCIIFWITRWKSNNFDNFWWQHPGGLDNMEKHKCAYLANKL